MENRRIRFNYPFAEAGERCSREALSRPDYDPCSLFRWGNMMAMAVLRMLEAAEAEFGRAGQEAMISALTAVGRQIGEEMLAGVELPDGMEPIELISAYASMINRAVYASPDAVRIEDKDHSSFDILWCPHQDSYRPFDCRVQRYLVQGMLDAAREKFPQFDFQVRVKCTIPAGAPVCKFEIERKREGEPDEWEAYSEVLAERALHRCEATAENDSAEVNTCPAPAERRG